MITVYDGLIVALLCIGIVLLAISLAYAFRTFMTSRDLRNELDLLAAENEDIAAENALYQEVTNFLYLLFLDLIETKDETDLAYKTTMLRSVIDLLEYDETMVKYLKKALTSPARMANSIDLILNKNRIVFSKEFESSYDAFMQTIDELRNEHIDTLFKVTDASHKAESGQLKAMRKKEESRKHKKKTVVENGVQINYTQKTEEIINDLRDRHIKKHDENPPEKPVEDISEAKPVKSSVVFVS